MSSKLYVGGLSYSSSQGDLEQAFSDCGTVLSATVINDRDTGRSKGFGFVEMSSEQEATAAIERWDGKDLDGRNITVNVAKERAPRRSNNGSGW